MKETLPNKRCYLHTITFVIGVLAGLIFFVTYMQRDPSMDIVIPTSPSPTTLASIRICTPPYVALIGSNSTAGSETFFEKKSMKDRLDYVRQQCRASQTWMDPNKKPVIGQQKFFVDSNQSVIICDLHKVGSHQLAGILQHMNNQTGNLFAYRFKVLKYLSADGANRSPHKKVMFIRDPMERLLSSYINNRAVRYINGSRVSFQTFLEDILETPVEKLDIHQQRFHDICQPCKIKYDVIGMLTTFQRDIALVFGSSGFNRTDHLHSNVRVGRNYMETYFKQVSQSVTHRIWERYRIDYFLFGFPYPRHLMDISLIPMFET